MNLTNGAQWMPSFLSLLVLAFAVACATPSDDRTEYAPPSLGENQFVDVADRKIAAGDILFVEVLEQKDLTVERRVEIEGWIQFPYLGKFQVAGKTTAEAAKELEASLRGKLLRNPIVSVGVKNVRMSTVTVLGSVMRGGSILLRRETPMNIIDAIGEAGGFQPVANKDKIELYRGGKSYRYRFEDLLREKDPSRRIVLEPGDVIFVWESIL